ncbi:MAG: hypothetical protein ACK54V_02305 [Candidatus Kapaibacterium sp.]|jgi:FlaA1/EpsC-like NDP-sugar epimerase
MDEVRSLGSLEGRRIVRDIYRELRFDRQYSGFTILATTWRVCTSEKELFRYSSSQVRVLHPLGFFRGTSLWMQEIINRFYSPTINSFVYFGAAVLLVMIGVRRFTDHISDATVLGSILFEAFLLIVMFLVLYFSPPEADDESDEGNTASASDNDVLREIGEIGRDYATVSMQMEQAVQQLQELRVVHEQLAERVRQSTEAAHLAVSPNPALVTTMEQTNRSLEKFQQSVEALHNAANKLQREEIDAAVRREVESLLARRVSG